MEEFWRVYKWFWCTHFLKEVWHSELSQIEKFAREGIAGILQVQHPSQLVPKNK